MSRSLLHGYFGYDFFISYAWSDSRELAVRLSGQLKSKKYDVFLDDVEMAGGIPLSRSIRKALRRTTVLIVIVSRDAIDSEFVLKEAELFDASGKTILPVNFDYLLDDLSPDHPLSLHLLDRIRLNVRTQSQTEEISDKITGYVEKTYNFVKRQRVRQISLSSVILLLCLLTTASIFGFLEQRNQTRIAESRRLTAEAQLVIQRKPYEAMHLAIKSLALNESVQSKRILLEGIDRLPKHRWRYTFDMEEIEDDTLRAPIVFLSDKDVIAVRSGKAGATLLNAEDGSSTGEFGFENFPPLAVDRNNDWPLARSSSGRYMLLKQSDHKASVFDLTQADSIRTLEMRIDERLIWALSDHGDYVGTLDKQGKFKLIDTATNSLIVDRQLLPLFGFSPYVLAIDAEREIVGAGYLLDTEEDDIASRVVSVWPWNDSKIIEERRGFESTIFGLYFSPSVDDKKLAIITTERLQIIFIDETKQDVIKRDAGSVDIVRYSPNGDLLGVGNTHMDGVRLLDTATGNTLAETFAYTVLEDFAFSYNGQTLFTSGIVEEPDQWFNSIDAWELDHAQGVFHHRTSTRNDPYAMAFHPGGKQIAISQYAENGNVLLINRNNSSDKKIIYPPPSDSDDYDYGSVVSYTNSGQNLIAMWSSRSSVKWDTENGQIIDHQVEPQRPVAEYLRQAGNLAVGIQGKRAVAGRAIEVWNPQTDQTIFKQSLSKKGRVVYSIDQSGRYLIWMLETDENQSNWQIFLKDLNLGDSVEQIIIKKKLDTSTVSALAYSGAANELLMVTDNANDIGAKSYTEILTFGISIKSNLVRIFSTEAPDFTLLHSKVISTPITELMLLPNNQHFAVLTDDSVDLYVVDEIEMSASLPIVSSGFRSINGRHLFVSDNSDLVGFVSGGDPYIQFWHWKPVDLIKIICNRLVDKNNCQLQGQGIN